MCPVSTASRGPPQPSSSVGMLPSPPDGGYGWVITAASFFGNSIVDGTCSIFAVLLPSLLSHYGGSRAKTTLAGSLMVGGFLMSGSVVSIILNKLGCRVTAMAGGLLVTVTLITSTFANSLDLFIFLYGAVGGFGLGLIYLPATVMVGFYFEAKRGIATGIATSGAGIGMLLFSLTTSWLIEIFDWRNALILLSGICLQAVVLGALMRPLEETSSKCNPDEKDGVPILLENGVQMNDTLEGKNLSVAPLSANDTTLNSSSVKCLPTHDAQDLQDREQLPKPKGHQLQRLLGQNSVSQSCGEISNLNSEMSGGHRLRSDTYSGRNPVKQGNVTSSSVSQLRKELLSRPLSRKDIFYSGSVLTLEAYKAQPNRDSYLASYVSLPRSEPDATAVSVRTKSCLTRLISCVTSCDLLDTVVIKSCPFLVITFANFLLHIAMFIPILFLADYAISLDIPARLAATLISAIGLCTTVGRASAGAVATHPSVNPVYMTSASVVVAGVATVLCIFVCKEYISLMAFAIVYGLSLAVFVPLTTLLLVDCVGLDHLTSAYGLLSTTKGIACFAGPPIAGGLFDVTGSYDLAFILAGVLFLASGCCFLLVPVAQRRQRNRDNIVMEIDDALN